MILRILNASPQRLSILLALTMALFGYFVLIGGAQASIREKIAIQKQCELDIASAHSTITHASEVAQLSAAVLKEVNGVEEAPNETELIKAVWLEAQRIAGDNGVTLTDLHHDKVRAIDLDALVPPPPATVNSVTCLPSDSADADGAANATAPVGIARSDGTIATPTQGANVTGAQGATRTQGSGGDASSAQGVIISPSAQGAKKRGAGVQLQVLPIIASMEGPYLRVIRTIAAFSKAKVLLKYDKSVYDVVPDSGIVKTTVTLLAYPPLKMDASGRPIGMFATRGDSALPSASASPTPPPNVPSGGNAP